MEAEEKKKKKRIHGELKDPQTITHTIDIQGLWLQRTGQSSQPGEWGGREVRAAETPRGVYGFMSVRVIKNVVISSL